MRPQRTETRKNSIRASEFDCQQATSQLEIKYQKKGSKKNMNKSGMNLINKNEVKSQFANNQFNAQNPAEHHLIKLVISVKLQQMGFSSQAYEDLINDKIKNYQARRLKEQNTVLMNLQTKIMSSKDLKSLISQISQQILSSQAQQIQAKKANKRDEIQLEQYSDSKVQVIQIKPKALSKIQSISFNLNLEQNTNQDDFVRNFKQYKNRPPTPVPLPSQVHQRTLITIPKVSEKIVYQFKQPKLCLICYYQSKKYQQLSCSHSFCNSCIKQVLLQDMNSGSYELKCPQYDCQARVPEQLAESLIGQSKFKKYMHFRKKMLLEADPSNHFCTKPDCQQLLVEKQGDSANLTCKRCKADFCKVCLQSTHVGECDVALKNKLQITYSQFKIKKCPKCQSPIQKIDGCNQMKCKKCKYNFCWLCLRKYSVHHFRYYNCFGCPGMQFEQEQQYCQQRLKQFFFFLLLPLILTLGVFIFIVSVPAYMIFCLFAKPLEWALRKNSEMCEMAIVWNICCCFHSYLQNFFAYMLFIPRALIYSIFLSPVKLIAIVLYQTCGLQTTCRRAL